MTDAETEYLKTAEEAARLGGALLLEWAGKFTVREKSRANLVTEADFASQKTIHEHIAGRFPDHGYLGEEGLATPASGSLFRWIIDPLDGTSNYVHGFPYYAVSIGLEHEGELILGVIFDPTRDEMFTAVRGAGAHLNGKPIMPTDTAQLVNAMAVASLPIAAKPDHPAVKCFLKVLPAAQTVQRTGSAALNLVYVASGRIDAFWSASLKPWDMAAGAVIVREAGGQVTNLEGNRFDVDQPSILATNGTALTSQLIELMATV